MSSEVFVAGSMFGNDDPIKRIRGFESLHAGYTSLEEGINAAMQYHRDNHAQEGESPVFEVYKSANGQNALIEVQGGGMLRSLGYYKVVRMMYVEKPELPQERWTPR
jgi:hypothetical protein